MGTKYNSVIFEKILKDEIKETKSNSKYNKDILENIIPKSAKKLESYFDDKSKICVELQKIFNKYNPRDIRRYCPAEYRRKYNKSKEDLFLELFSTMEKVMKDFSKLSETMRKDMINSKNRKALEKIILNNYKESDLIKLRNEIDDTSVQLKLIKNKLNSKQKIDPFLHSMIKSMSLDTSKRHIAKLFDISPKRVSQLCNSDE